MITVTPSAAQQIRIAASRSDADELGLRIAARRDEQGALHYAMGFDEAREGDVVVPSEGIALVVAANDLQRDLLLPDQPNAAANRRVSITLLRQPPPPAATP